MILLIMFSIELSVIMYRTHYWHLDIASEKLESFAFPYFIFVKFMCSNSFRWTVGKNDIKFYHLQQLLQFHYRLSFQAQRKKSFKQSLTMEIIIHHDLRCYGNVLILIFKFLSPFSIWQPTWWYIEFGCFFQLTSFFNLTLLLLFLKKDTYITVLILVTSFFPNFFEKDFNY